MQGSVLVNFHAGQAQRVSEHQLGANPGAILDVVLIFSSGASNACFEE